MFRISAVLAVAMMVFVPGCPPDTCTQGENMTNPQVVGGLERVGAEYQVRITWERGTGVGAELPEEYFAAVNLGTVAGTPVIQNELVRSVRLSGPRELTVTFQSDFDPATAGTVSFRLFFPDRRGFIACSHPGDEDEYFLDVTLELTAQGTLQNAVLEQGKRLGEI